MANRLAALALLSIVAAGPAAADDPAPRDRHAFAQKVGSISVGQPQDEVREQLGAPDDTQSIDPSAQDAWRSPTHPKARLAWRYGARGPGSLATLGTVVFDGDAKVLQVFGGAPCKLEKGAFDEHELERLLRVLDTSPSYNNGYAFDPVTFVRVVNALHEHGKARALAAIREYVRIAPQARMAAYEGLYLVLRALFDVPDDPGTHPHMYVGAPTPAEPREHSQFPRFPLVIRGDVPFLIVSGYTLAGCAEPLEAHLAHFEQNGRLRNEPMAPAEPETAGRAVLDDLAKATFDVEPYMLEGLRTTHRTLVFSQVRRARNLGSVHWRTLAGTTTTEWGERSAGLAIRVTAPRALEAGLGLPITVDIDARPDELREGVSRLNRFLHPAYLSLYVERIGAGPEIEAGVRPYDPTAGMLAHDDGSDATTLGDAEISLVVTFPLVTLPGLVPGRYRGTVTWSQPGRSDWMDADSWTDNGFWAGTVQSAPFEIDVLYPYPSERRIEVPTRLRLTDDLTLVTDARDVEEQRVPSRNGYFVSTRWSVDDEMFMLRGLAFDPLNPTIDDLMQRKPRGPMVTYTVEVFETRDPPQHLWMPHEGSGGYKVLFRRDFVIRPTPAQLKRLGLVR